MGYLVVTMVLFLAGLNVCFLTDSMCRGLDQYCEGAYCWVHPGTTLVRSAQQHVYHLRRVNGDALLIVHIGTNDVASGVSAETIVNRMALLVERLRHSFKYKLYFAICSVLPRYVDDKQTKHTVKRCNILLERWSSEMDNVVFFANVESLCVWRMYMFWNVPSRWTSLECERERSSFSVFQTFFVELL